MLLLWLLLLQLHLAAISSIASSTLFINGTFGLTPKYCVRDEVVAFFRPRYQHCMIEGDVYRELSYLREHSASDYQHAHELLAHLYFLDPLNPHRAPSCDSADGAVLEYIPLMPLSWRTGLPTNTLCTANGYCPPTDPHPDSQCSYRALVDEIVSYVEDVTITKGQKLSDGLPKFSVAGTFNLRTSIGFGLPGSSRKGRIYDAVTSLVVNSYMGHYERHPQCPDVLRKWWRHVTEIPYLPTQTLVNVQEKTLTIPQIRERDFEKNVMFFFSGRLLLWGPERVCSVRCAVATIASRSDSVIINVTDQQASGPVSNGLLNRLQESVFCLIAKADSYSTAAFYDAIQAGCLPIVISNWFIFSFPTFINYAEFTIRLEENDFMRDPHGCLDAVLEMYGKDKRKEMVSAMRRWAPYLSYEFQEVDIPEKGKIKTIVPFELLLRELHVVQTTEACPKCIYMFCHRPQLCDGEVKPLDLRDKLKETRPHLCQHAGRLIGHYKIVYFMSCVRILWPLKLGQFKPIDLQPGALSEQHKKFVLAFHNVSIKNEAGDVVGKGRPDGWNYVTYPELDEEVRKKVKNYEKLPAP